MGTAGVDPSSLAAKVFAVVPGTMRTAPAWTEATWKTNRLVVKRNIKWDFLVAMCHSVIHLGQKNVSGGVPLCGRIARKNRNYPVRKEKSRKKKKKMQAGELEADSRM